MSLVKKNNLCYIPASILNKPANVLLDTGASEELLNSALLLRGYPTFRLFFALHGLSAAPIRVTCAAYVNVTIRKHFYPVLFRLIPVHFPTIFGMTFFKEISSRNCLERFSSQLERSDKAFGNTAPKVKNNKLNISAKFTS